jgi:hypothetical protein
MSALDISKPLPRLPGATGGGPVIAGFLDELCEAGREHGLLTETHVEFLRSVLINIERLAGEDAAAYGAFWEYTKGAITKTEWPVKRRLEELHTIGDVFNRAYSRRLPPASQAAH